MVPNRWTPVQPTGQCVVLPSPLAGLVEVLILVVLVLGVIKV